MPGVDIDTDQSSVEMDVGARIPAAKPAVSEPPKNDGEKPSNSDAPLKNYLNVSTDHVDSEHVSFIFSSLILSHSVITVCILSSLQVAAFTVHGYSVFLAHLACMPMRLCNHELSFVWCPVLSLSLLLSVNSPPSHRFDHRNLISCTYMHICP